MHCEFHLQAIYEHVLSEYVAWNIFQFVELQVPNSKQFRT